MKRIRNIWNKLKNNTIKKIKAIKKEHTIKEYCNNNVLFFIFVIINILNATVLRFFCMHSLENYLSWKAILADTMIVTAIGSFGYLIKPKNRFIYYLGFSIFLTAICFANTNGVWLVFVVCGVVQVLAILFFLLRNDKNYFKKLFHKKHKDEDEENK